MADDSFSQIKSAAARVRKLRKNFNKISVSLENTEWWKQRGLSPLLKNIITGLENAENMLDHPCLKIAVVGTTSSGKSTLLNGLSGHRIAPMEAGEMSAGVVCIRNGREISLTVRETESMTWRAGPYPVSTDADIYDALRNQDTGIMNLYRKGTEKNAGVMAPEIDITIPLAPKCGGIPQFLMPEFLDLKFYDLPGLKSVTDSRNLEVIQRHLASSFLLIVLNYSDTDSEKRKTLLKEIKKIVLTICRNKEALLFVLNRVDERNSEDDPLEVRIASLQENIREELELPELPPVIPMSGLPLYFLQTAWGAEQEPLYEKGLVEKFKTQIQKFFGDCAKIIDCLRDDSEEKDDWFATHTKRNIGDPEKWDGDDPRKLLHWIYEYSGGYRFWEALQKKLDEQIGAIIINPALGELPALMEDFSKKFEGIVKLMGLNTEEEIREKQKEVEALGEEIKKDLQEFKNGFIRDFKDSIEACKKLRSQLIKIEELKKMGTIMQEISSDVHDTIMVPIKNALVAADADRLDDLELSLEKVVPKELARNIRRMTNNLLLKGYGRYAEEGKTFECRNDEKEKHTEEINELEGLEKRRLDLAGYVDQAMLARSKLLLQERMNFFQEITGNVIRKSMEAVRSRLREKMQGAADIQDMFGSIESKPCQIDLPGNVFSKISISDAVKIMQKTVREKY
jgi:GTPase SAR1 family protein